MAPHRIFYTVTVTFPDREGNLKKKPLGVLHDTAEEAVEAAKTMFPASVFSEDASQVEYVVHDLWYTLPSNGNGFCNSPRVKLTTDTGPAYFALGTIHAILPPAMHTLGTRVYFGNAPDVSCLVRETPDQIDALINAAFEEEAKRSE